MKHYSIDTTHSTAQFQVDHLVMSRYRGTFTHVEGQLDLDDANPANSRVTASIRGDSVSGQDPKLRAVLLGTDFLDVEHHPTLTFESTAVRRVKDKSWEADGTLSIRGVEQPTTLTITEVGERVNPFYQKTVRAFSASASISRKAYGITWNAPLLGGEWYLGDRIDIDLAIEALA